MAMAMPISAVVAAAGLEVLTGRGDGTFQAAPAYPSGGQKVVGDFNGDGIADLVVNVNFDTIGILMGRPDGTFAPEIDFPVPNGTVRTSRSPTSTATAGPT